MWAHIGLPTYHLPPPRKMGWLPERTAREHNMKGAVSCQVYEMQSQAETCMRIFLRMAWTLRLQLMRCPAR